MSVVNNKYISTNDQTAYVPTDVYAVSNVNWPISLRFNNYNNPNLYNLKLFSGQVPSYSLFFSSYLRNSRQLNLLKILPQLQTTGTGTVGTGTTAQIAAVGIDLLTSQLSGQLNSALGDSALGLNLGAIFSSGIGAAGNTMSNNLLKGASLTEGLGRDVGKSVGGTAAGIGANLIGLGIDSLGGHSMLSRGIGQGVATGLGTVGGRAITLGTKGLFGANAINPWGLGMSVVGTGLSAAFGPSKEYEGKHGSITRTMDSVYDAAQAAMGFIPGYGQVVAGAMALNKGLSNIFGSTSGMTAQDAILGSAFMPAPVKWLNMAGAKTTGNFNNLSWQNINKTNEFMQNAFGDLGDRFNLAREEANKTYGTFSRRAYNKALNNLNFANGAFNLVLAMADLNELQNIRSRYMSSINNLKYAQDIQGGWQPVYRGKQGMKILNNATDHNMAMRLLSGAALIDNKQMMLCSAAS